MPDRAIFRINWRRYVIFRALGLQYEHVANHTLNTRLTAFRAKVLHTIDVSINDDVE